ncbi:hypothetical protein [Polaribacter sp.]|uniref:hypothetical protein n=2 Tax=Polaribacter sp. TaxID=1920175 RepID=UPI0040489F16
MKTIVIFFIFLFTSSIIVSQTRIYKNEDTQGEITPNETILEIDQILKNHYPYEHKSIYIEGDSIFHINKFGKRRIRIRDIDNKSLVVSNEKDSYKIVINCYGNERKMIADWGKYSGFGFDMKNKQIADELLKKFKKLLNEF